MTIDNIKVSANPELIINEVFPNPDTGSEWIEIYHLGENLVIASDYAGFSLSDDKRIIYTFQGDELWSGNFLVIEVSGLNNDRDSVILQNAEELVIDQMSYPLSQKNLSWLRINPDEPIFILGEASPLQFNSIPPSAPPNPSPTFSPLASPAPTSPSPNPSPNPNLNVMNTPMPTANPTNTQQHNDDRKKTATEPDKKQSQQPLSAEALAQNYFANYQDDHNLQITYSPEKQFPQTRLVFLGQKMLKPAIIDAIIGSSLLILAAILLSYENKAKKAKGSPSSVF